MILLCLQYMHYNMPAVYGQQLWAVRIWRRRSEAGARSSTLRVVLPR